MAEGKAVRSITGRQVTVAPSEAVLLTVDGAAPAASIAVPAGTTLVIGDVIVGTTGPGNAIFHVEQDNGPGFYAIAHIESPPGPSAPTTHMQYGTGLVVNGGPSTVVRVRVETVAPELVLVTLRSYTAP